MIFAILLSLGVAGFAISGLFDGSNDDIDDAGEVSGGDAPEKIVGDDGHDAIKGGAGDDTIDGGDYNDLIEGGNGQDTLAGGRGADAISGNAGNDVIEGGNWHDVLVGGTLRMQKTGVKTASFCIPPFAARRLRFATMFRVRMKL